jgi:hypothetical protein
MAATTESVHSLWTSLAKYQPERVAKLVDFIFSKYDQPFELVTVDEKANKVVIRLKDGKRVELPI